MPASNATPVRTRRQRAFAPAPSRPAPPCPVCGSADAIPWAVGWDAEYRTTDDRFTFHRCNGCGVLHIDPVPSDRLAEIYPSNYYAFATNQKSPVHKVKDFLDRALFRKLLGPMAGPGLSVLDVGGGSGWHLDMIRRTDRRVAVTQVVDMDPGAAELARSKGHDYYCGIIEDYQTDRRYDLVLLLNLIEHVADPLAILTKVRSMLSPQGVVLVKTPNYESLDARCFRHRNWAGYHCPRHWVLFTRESFTGMAARAGLGVRRFTYTQGAHFWANSILYALAARGLISVTQDRPSVFHPLYPLLSGAFAGFDFLRRPFARTSQMFFILDRG
jgi:2-polyprenyl-3-methyl-5-hydroxy-6-metoxy-1,4-benzoquinol methylase